MGGSGFGGEGEGDVLGAGGGAAFAAAAGDDEELAALPLVDGGGGVAGGGEFGLPEEFAVGLIEGADAVIEVGGGDENEAGGGDDGAAVVLTAGIGLVEFGVFAEGDLPGDAAGVEIDGGEGAPGGRDAGVAFGVEELVIAVGGEGEDGIEGLVGGGDLIIGAGDEEVDEGAGFGAGEAGEAGHAAGAVADDGAEVGAAAGAILFINLFAAGGGGGPRPLRWRWSAPSAMLQTSDKTRCAFPPTHTSVAHERNGLHPMLHHPWPLEHQ